MDSGPSISSMFMSDISMDTSATVDVSANNTGSSFMGSMFTGGGTETPSTTPMTIGQNLSETLGNSGEVMQQEGSSLGKVAMGAVVVGGAFKLVDALSAPPMTPAQQQEIAKQQIISQDDQRKSAIMKEDARKAEAGAEQERRRAFFAAKP